MKVDSQELVPWMERPEESKEAKLKDIWRNVLERRTSRMRPGSIKRVSVKMSAQGRGAKLAQPRHFSEYPRINFLKDISEEQWSPLPLIKWHPVTFR